MTESREAAAVMQALDRSWRRSLAIAAIDGAAVGAGIAVVVVAALWIAHRDHAIGIAGAIVAGGLAVAVVRALLRRDRWPHDLEQRAPVCRNSVVTASELIADATRTRPGLVALVCADAAQRIEGVDWNVALPFGRAVARAGVALVVALAAAATVHAYPRRSGDATVVVAPGTAPAINRVTIAVDPPSYTGLSRQQLNDPSEIHAIAGSRISVRVEATANAVGLETADGRTALTRAPDGAFTGALSALADGYLSIEPEADAIAGAKRLIGLIVGPDQPPVVRIDKPGKDLFVPDVAAPIAIAISAQDDLGLASLKLAYTKVTGSGENFSFAEGDVPIALAKTDDRHWRATVSWNLAPLALAPGDMVVYHAIAADRRPGAAPVPSDAFIVQVLTPNQAAVGGFSIDDDPNKFALSQRMVILKTEKLDAKKAAMAPSDFSEEALGIAAEQRQVRAMFVFMMGGEFEDEAVSGALNEVTEAEAESDIAAGRLHNQARVDLMIATRHMSEAAASLAVPSLADAVKSEKAALDSIQKAFSKDRYLLRTLATEERIDLARRLSGTLSGTVQAPVAPMPADDDPTATALRRLLARTAAVASSGAPDHDRTTELASLADAALRIDPASRPMQAISAQFSKAATMAGQPDARRSLIDQAAKGLATQLKARTSEGPRAQTGALQSLDGALADALRQRGGR
jgi:hypothetical protein